MNYKNQVQFTSNTQALSALVVNLPYNVDSFTSAPKVDKTLSLPFGIKATTKVIANSISKVAFNSLAIMMVLSFSLSFFNAPMNVQNTTLLNSSKSLVNEQFTLIASAHEASSYDKLFASAEEFKFVDAKEVIKVKQAAPKIQNKKEIAKAPLIQFSGF